MLWLTKLLEMVIKEGSPQSKGYLNSFDELEAVEVYQYVTTIWYFKYLFCWYFTMCFFASRARRKNKLRAKQVFTLHESWRKKNVATFSATQSYNWIYIRGAFGFTDFKFFCSSSQHITEHICKQMSRIELKYRGAEKSERNGKWRLKVYKIASRKKDKWETTGYIFVHG